MNRKLLLFGMTIMMAFVFSCKDKKDEPSDKGDSTPPYTIQLTEITNDRFPSLHSFTHAIYQDSIIVMFGGRTSGLHAFSYTFSHSYSDSVIYVINTHNLESPNNWTIDSMRYENDSIPGNYTNAIAFGSDSIPQLKSTIDKRFFIANNAEFYTKDSMLYVFGGVIGAFGTTSFFAAPYLTVINLPELVKTVRTKRCMKPNSIRQVYDTSFAITGGEINVMNNKTYLTFGWNGTYYSHQVKVYSINDNGSNLIVKKDTTYSDGLSNDPDTSASGADTGHYRRRDGSMCLMNNPTNGNKMLFYYAGVFQNGYKPFTSVVMITDSGAHEIYDDSFKMRSNIYTCQIVPVYDSQNKMSYATFLGGITNSVFNPSASDTKYPIKLSEANARIIDTINKSNNFHYVPFTNRFSTVCYGANGKLSQYMLADSFPASRNNYYVFDNNHDTVKVGGTLYNGAESELFWTIPSKYLVNGMINYNALPGDTTTVGYLYGGILSSLPNVLAKGFPANQNGGSHRYSMASNRLFKVSIVKTHKK